MMTSRINMPAYGFTVVRRFFETKEELDCPR